MFGSLSDGPFINVFDDINDSYFINKAKQAKQAQYAQQQNMQTQAQVKGISCELQGQYSQPQAGLYNAYQQAANTPFNNNGLIGADPFIPWNAVVTQGTNTTAPSSLPYSFYIKPVKDTITMELTQEEYNAIIALRELSDISVKFNTRKGRRFKEIK